MKPVRGFIVPADDGPIQQVEIKSLEDMQAAVGGYIEYIHIEGASGFINEEGKLRNLSLNRRATKLWHKAHGIECDDIFETIASFDIIVGPLLILGVEDEDGESTDAPDLQTLGL